MADPFRSGENPLSGLQDLSFDDAAEIAGRTWQARSHDRCPVRPRLSEGRFTLADLVAAAGGLDLPAEIVADYLCRRADWRPPGRRCSAPNSCSMN